MSTKILKIRSGESILGHPGRAIILNTNKMEQTFKQMERIHATGLYIIKEDINDLLI